jgi:hypothetical protein
LAADDRRQARGGSERQDVPPTPLRAFFMFSVILVVGIVVQLPGVDVAIGGRM